MSNGALDQCMSFCFAISHWPSQHLLYRSKTIKHQHSWSFHLFSSQPSPQEHRTEVIYLVRAETGQRHGVLCLPGHCFVAKFLGWSLKPGITEERTIDTGCDVFCRTCDLGGFTHFGNQSVPTQMMNSKSWEQWISMLFRNPVSNLDMNGGIPSWNLKVPRFHWWTHWTHPQLEQSTGMESSPNKSAPQLSGSHPSTSLEGVPSPAAAQWKR